MGAPAMNTIQWLLAGEHWQGPDGIPTRFFQHVKITLLAVGLASALALPVGLWLGHKRRGGFVAVNASNVGRAIPTLAILIIFAASDAIGIGDRAAIYALAIFALPPILTNTYVGMMGVDPDAVEAARGMGMRERQVVFKVEVPLAMPLIAAGLRTATVQVVATATLAAIVAGGGLGRYIVDGFATQDRPEVYAGAVLVASLALLTEAVLGALERRVTPGKRRPRTQHVLATVGVGS
jgi:osmoprotectant transport system permease protein